MRILIITQVLDKSHTDLGFFHAWVEEFAKQCEHLTVVCLYEGEHALPKNVTVLSLGKDKRKTRLTYLIRFYSYAMGKRNDYDAVFVHMNPEYVILGGIFWRLISKPVGLWYVHKQVTWRLRIAAILATHIFTVSKESFRLNSPKVRIFGHGIDVQQFSSTVQRTQLKRKRILMLGRISPSKRIDVGIELMKFFLEEREDFEMVVVGEPMTAGDEGYLRMVQKMTEDYGLEDLVSFAGSVVHSDAGKQYLNADIFLHTSSTGSVDKVVLEALASGLPVISTSEAFTNTPGVVSVPSGDVAEIAEAVRNAFNSAVLSRIGVEYVKTKHSLPSLITRIVRSLDGSQ